MFQHCAPNCAFSPLRPFVKHSNFIWCYNFAGRMGSVAAIHWTLLNTQKKLFLLTVGFRV